jgi:signal transduction histidine kinase
MRRRAKPAKAKVEAKLPVARKLPKSDSAKVRDLERRLAEAREQQRATSEILGVISRSPSDVAPVFATIARNAMHLLGGATGGVFLLTGDRVHLGAAATRETIGPIGDLTFPMSLSEFSRHRPVLAQVLETRAPASVADMETDPRTTTEARHFAHAVGFRSNAIVPMLRDDELIGLIVVARAEPRATTDDEMALLKTFSDQAVIAIENVRLFKELQASNREIAEKSRQIEVASQHKSEFLANMSHELRTPLNAIIGFSEVLTDRMFGELNEKQEEYLKDIYASGTHLLSLINDILDLSKIETGRMELELTDFHLPTALDNALTLVRERAGRRNIALHTSIDNRLGEQRGDERKIRQVVLNLLSNAIKFTPEGGRIEVAAVPKGRVR